MSWSLVSLEVFLVSLGVFLVSLEVFLVSFVVFRCTVPRRGVFFSACDAAC